MHALIQFGPYQLLTNIECRMPNAEGTGNPAAILCICTHFFFLTSCHRKSILVYMFWISLSVADKKTKNIMSNSNNR